MKIIFITTGLGMGGAEHQICDLADSLCSLGHDVIIISITRESILLPKNQKIKIIKLDMVKNIPSILKAYFKLRSIIKKEIPDVVHSHMVHANIFTRLLRLTTKINKLICTAHSTNEGGKVLMLAYRYTDFLADITTNVSQEAVDEFVKLGACVKNKIIPVYNGVDTENYKFKKSFYVKKRNKLNLQDNDYLFLAVGRLKKEKDYPNLLYAFKQVVELNLDSHQSKQVHLAIIGDGDLIEELKSLAVRLRIRQFIHFLGLQYDVEQWMCAADTFVLSSEFEGFGLVVAEAMLTERVVVATDCGGVREVVEDCGYLIPPQNSILLSQAMQKTLLLTDIEKKQLGMLARKRIENKFSLKAITNKWLEIYQGHYK
ncbi:glycosyltransferase [Photobacterium phosphoreum]|uniref:glycosyltransferase n=1 Tax=Photobacterium phosphoreum TaxID=659 RepID=UPI0039AF1609